MGGLKCFGGQSEDQIPKTTKKDLSRATKRLKKLKKVDTVTQPDGSSTTTKEVPARDKSPSSDIPFESIKVRGGNLQSHLEEFLSQLSELTSQSNLLKSNIGIPISDPSEVVPTFPNDKATLSETGECSRTVQVTQQPTDGRKKQKFLEEKVQNLEAKLSEKEMQKSKILGEMKAITNKNNALQIELFKAKNELFKVQETLDIVQGQLDKATIKMEQISQSRVCVMSINQQKLEPIVAGVRQMQIAKQIRTNYQIIEKKLAGGLSISEDDFEVSKRVILVGISEPRNLLISDSEPSQLGVVYREAQKIGKDVFFIFVDTKYEDSLKDNQAYHASLGKLLENQSAIGKLAQNNRFISVKCREKDNVQKLNQAQCQLISNWLG